MCSAALATLRTRTDCRLEIVGLMRTKNMRIRTSLISTHMMNREIITGRIKRVPRCLYSLWQPSSSVKVVIEAERRGWPLADAAHSTSQG